MRHFDATATRAALPFDRLIPALKAMFRAGCEVPLRHTHKIESPTASGTCLVMPAWTNEHLGIKTVNIFPGNSARGLPGLFSTYTLYDAQTGQPIAQMDGDEITARRTAAASALAASLMLAHGPRRLLVVGAGRVGRLVPEAYAAVFPLAAVTVWDRTEAHARAVCEALRSQGIPAAIATDLEAAVREADTVTCATLATEPVVRGAWLRPDSHLDLIGSFTPEMREADDACFAGARLFIDTPEALIKSGELLGPMHRGVFAASDVRGTLESLCRDGDVRREAGRTVFKSVGTALEDLAAARLVARSSGSPPENPATTPRPSASSAG